MKQPWIISVLSTAYDLQEHRKALISMLKEKNITVSAYELPEFPVEADKHSHDSCLVALRRVDIALVIIDKRSGGTYCGIDENNAQISITEAEYLEAIKEGIPVFIFVKKEAKDELHGYKKELKNYCEKHGIPVANSSEVKKASVAFDEEYVCKYVEKVQTLHFIEDVQNAYRNYSVSNWMDFFDDIENLKECVEGKLNGYSRALMQKLSVAQNKSLLNKHTSTSIGMTLRDVFSSEYYIEPPHEVISGEMLIDKGFNSLSESIANVLATDNSVLIYGEAGYGKTTIIARCFSEHVERLKKNPTYEIPLFLPLRNKGSDYSFDIVEYINDELGDLLHKEVYPYLNLQELQLRFYCDGFDELAESLTESDLDRIRKSGLFEYPLLLTCRQQFVTRYLNVHNFTDVFGVRIQMKKWNVDTVEKYITNYYEKKKIDKRDIEKIIHAIRKNTELQQLIDSPLLITMFLWFLEKDNEGKNVDEISKVELFKCLMYELATREHSKNTSLSSALILSIWEFVAWQLYLHRKNNDKLIREDLIEMISEVFSGINVDHVILTFDALFEWKSDYLCGTFHEQFMEYLVAKLLVRACINKEEPYPVFLKYVLRPEINRYFRGICKEESKRRRETVYDSILNQYLENVGKTDNEAIATRVHAVYHMSRLESDKRVESINRAFQTEKNISVLLSLYFGAIKLAMIDKEKDFYDLLKVPEYSEANRGYHLAYYADMIESGTLPYVDDNVSEWQGTLKAIERHFETEDLSHYLLRRIELFTIKELIVSRKKAFPLTQEILNKFEILILNSPYSCMPEYTEFFENTKKEYEELVKVFEAYKNV